LPRSTVVVANHQIYTDWIYMWVFAYYAKSAEHIVIMLKSSLKDLPIFGWGMQIFEFIFLDRRWANDKVTIDKHIEMIHESELPTWLMLYPEGTVPSGNTVPKSLKYASDNKVSHPTNLLLPRSTGLHYTINQLRSDPRIKYLTDLTIGYSGLAKGEIPHYIYTIPGYYMYSDAPDTVHFHVRKIRIDSIPEDEEEFAKWTRKLWMDKDELLNVFYETGKFP
ncbi:acyltransferase-domain-containing protein, partial [Ramicandelaber brevisporus]